MRTSGGILQSVTGFWVFMLILPLFYFSCETNFEPSGENFIEIDTSQDIRASVFLSHPDTLGLLIIEDQIDITYSLDIGSLRIYEVKIFLDSLPLHTGNSTSGTFYYDPNQFSDGFHTLRIDFITSSGSGSLADISGAEGFQIYQEWGVINISNATPDPLEVLRVYPSRGQLQIEWEKYDRLNFGSYELLSSRALGATHWPEDTTFIDPYYIGGEISYRVQITTSAGSTLGPRFTYSSPVPGLIGFEQVEPNSIKLRWSKCAFPGNFGRYAAAVQDLNSQTFSNIDDTSAIFENVPFGESLYSVIYTFPDANDDWFEYYKNDGENIIWSGTKIGISSREAVYIPDNDRLYLIKSGSINRLNGSTMALESTHSFPASYGADISMDGSHIAIRQYKRISRLDPTSLEPITELDLESLLGWIPEISALAVANGDLLFFAAQNTANTDGIKVFALDMAQEIILDSILVSTPENYTDAMQCTQDGAYVAYDYEMFQFTGSQFSRHSNRYNAEYLRFLPNSEQFHYTFISEPVKLFDISTLTSSVTFGGSSAISPTLDPVTEYLGYYAWQSGLYKIYESATGDFVDQFPAKISTSGHITLFNNKVISSAGFMRNAFD